MSDVVVLITGANRGIGFELTKQYLINGCTVIATCRDKNRADELISLNATYSDKLSIKSMDITCSEQIERLANTLSEENLEIDLIVNNLRSQSRVYSIRAVTINVGEKGEKHPSQISFFPSCGRKRGFFI